MEGGTVAIKKIAQNFKRAFSCVGLKNLLTYNGLFCYLIWWTVTSPSLLMCELLTPVTAVWISPMFFASIIILVCWIR